MKLNLLFAAVLCSASPAQAGVGEFLFVYGDVRVLQGDGKERAAHKGATIDEGDSVVIGKSGSAQLRMSDNGLIALRPDSQMRVETYRYAGREDGSERGVLGLLKGGFRTLTGVIGRANKSSYLVRTPNATIGIRGTDHEPLYIPPPAPGETPIGQPGTYNKVNVGETFIETASGRVELGANQVGYAGLLAGIAPTRLERIPDFMRATPQPQGRDDRRQMRAAAVSDQRRDVDDRQRERRGPPIAPLQGVPQFRQQTLGESFDFVQSASSLTSAPAGYAGVGGDKSTFDAGGLPTPFVGSGAMVVVPGASAIFFGPDGNPVLINSGEGFTYARNGAPMVDAGGAILPDPGGATPVRWGVYAGGAIIDSRGPRSADLFHFMGAQSTPPAVQQTLSGTYNNLLGSTRIVNENGVAGGAVSSVAINLSLGRLASYSFSGTDGQGRSFSGCAFACSVGSVSLPDFAKNGVVLGPGSSLDGAPAIGRAQGVAIGPTGHGIISSFDLKNAGSRAVTGSFVVKR